MQETPVQLLGYPLQCSWASLVAQMVKNPACSVGDLGSIPGWGRSPGGGHGNPLQCSCLENPHGQRNLVGYSPWGHKKSDTTERLSTHTHCIFIMLRFCERLSSMNLCVFCVCYCETLIGDPAYYHPVPL